MVTPDPHCPSPHQRSEAGQATAADRYTLFSATLQSPWRRQTPVPATRRKRARAGGRGRGPRELPALPLTAPALFPGGVHPGTGPQSGAESGSQQGVGPPVKYASYIHQLYHLSLCLSSCLYLSRAHTHIHIYTHTTHSRRVWAGVCGAGQGSCPQRWRSGLCPGQGGGRNPDGDVERPRGAVRGRAGRREPRRPHREAPRGLPAVSEPRCCL